MTTTIKAQVIRRAHPSENDPTPWCARAVAFDHEPGRDQHPIVGMTKTGYAPSHPEALQLAQVARDRLHDVLMDEVHESRATRRTSKETIA